MPINSPQAVRFCNEKLRPSMDRLVSAIRTVTELKAEYAAQNLAPSFAGSQEISADTVDDNATNDGRTVLTGYDVDNAMSKVTALLTSIDAGMLGAFQKPAVNTAPVI